MNGGIGWVYQWLEAAGLEPAVLGEAAVESALKRRLEASGCNEAAYRARLAADPQERTRLVEAVLVPETWFFREPPAFAALAEAVSRYRADGRATPFRVLSLGCSTGEEAWSIAMTLREAGLDSPLIRIEALDISTKAIDAARAGIYGGRSFRHGGDGAWRSRYFDMLDHRRYRLKDELRRDVDFRVANIAEDRWSGQVAGFDAVFCRNVLIYLRPEIRARILSRCRETLVPGGLLVLGHADAIGEFADGFARHPAAGAFSWIRREPCNMEQERQPGPAKPDRASLCVRQLPGRSLSAPKISRQAAVRRGLDHGHAGNRPGSPSNLPPGGEPLIAGARALADGGDYAGAERLCRDYLAGNPQDAEIHALLGMIMAAADREDEALNHFRRALYLAPAHRESLAHMAALYERRGDGERARHYRNRSSRPAEGS